MQEIFLPSIWSASPCALPYSNRMASFQKSKRFQFNSIYYKDDPSKPKNQQSPLSRPQIILNEFRKKIKQAAKSYHTAGYIKKKKIRDLQDKKLQTLNLKATQVTGRLYQSPSSILQLKYDQNGNRSSFYESQNINQKQNHNSGRSLSPKQLVQVKMQYKMSDNVYITSTPRTDLSKPLNFNPGPGSYLLFDDKSHKLMMKSKMSGKSLLNSIDDHSSVNLNKSVLDSKSIMSGKQTNDNKKTKFSTLDYDESFKERRNNLFMKRLQKSKNQRSIL